MWTREWFAAVKPMNEALLRQENAVHAKTGGRSEENASLGFRPAFYDFATQKIYLSRFPDGRLAPCHQPA